MNDGCTDQCSCEGLWYVNLNLEFEGTGLTGTMAAWKNDYLALALREGAPCP